VVSGGWDPMSPWVGMTSGSWDPVSPWAGMTSGSWDPTVCPASGFSAGPGSRDPHPLAEELPCSCVASGSGHSATSTMLTASAVAAM
jgi:hypothetical protein